MEETERDVRRAACEVELLLVQSLLMENDKNVRGRFLQPVNISGDLCGHKAIITNYVLLQ